MTKLVHLLAGALALSGCAAGPLLASAAFTGGIAQLSPLAPLASARESFVVRANATSPVAPETVLVDRRGITLTALANADRPLAIRRASLAAAASAPCSQSTAIKALWLDDYRRWDRPVGWSGQHRFELEFATPRDLLAQPTALDVLLVDGENERCVRAPLAGADLGTTLRRETPWTTGGGFGLLFAQSPGSADRPAGYGAGFSLSGSVGAWSGLWRGSGRGDFLVTDVAGTWHLSLPIVLGVERVVPLSKRVTLGLALGYQPGRIEDFLNLWAQRRTWSHGPRIGFMLLGGRGVADADPRQGFAARGIGLFVQRQWSPVVDTPDAPPPAWILGLEATAL